MWKRWSRWSVSGVKYLVLDAGKEAEWFNLYEQLKDMKSFVEIWVIHEKLRHHNNLTVNLL